MCYPANINLNTAIKPRFFFGVFRRIFAAEILKPTLMDQCTEKFLSEVVHIELIPAALCSFPIPFGVSEITEMTGCTFGLPSMIFDVNEGDGVVALSDTPQIKITPHSQAAGHLRTHELQLNVLLQSNVLQSACASLSDTYFICVLTQADGTRYLILSLPGTSVVTLDDALSTEHRQTVKVSLQSLSGLILLP